MTDFSPPAKKMSGNLCEIFHRVDTLMGNQITLHRLKSTKLGLLMFLEKLRLNDKKENVESLDQFLT